MMSAPTIRELELGRPMATCNTDFEADNVESFRYQYFQDLGSLLADDIPDVADSASEVIEWCREHMKGPWAWKLEDRNIFGDAEDGTVGEDALTLKDVRKYLMISFDLSGDAMLSRMTWQNLKGIRYANSRGLSRKAR